MDLGILFLLQKIKLFLLKRVVQESFWTLEDIARVRLEYSNGGVADMFASSVLMERYRK